MADECPLGYDIMKLEGEAAEKFHQDMNTPLTPEQKKYQKEALEYYESKCGDEW